MKVEKGSKLLIIRYSDFLIKGCIRLHMDVLDEKGYVWFGKVGKQKPSDKYVRLTLSEPNPRLILHSSTKDYLCDITEVCYEKPIEGYPDYYNDVLYANNNNPSIYFKITSFRLFEHKYLHHFVVNSSRNELPYSLHGSMNSLFFIECIEDINEEDE